MSALSLPLAPSFSSSSSSSSSLVALIVDEACMASEISHAGPPTHPETPKRISAILSVLQREGFLAKRPGHSSRPPVRVDRPAEDTTSSVPLLSPGEADYLRGRNEDEEEKATPSPSLVTSVCHAQAEAEASTRKLLSRTSSLSHSSSVSSESCCPASSVSSASSSFFLSSCPSLEGQPHDHHHHVDFASCHSRLRVLPCLRRATDEELRLCHAPDYIDKIVHCFSPPSSSSSTLQEFAAARLRRKKKKGEERQKPSCSVSSRRPPGWRTYTSAPNSSRSLSGHLDGTDEKKENGGGRGGLEAETERDRESHQTAFSPSSSSDRVFSNSCPASFSSSSSSSSPSSGCLGAVVGTSRDEDERSSSAASRIATEAGRRQDSLFSESQGTTVPTNREPDEGPRSRDEGRAPEQQVQGGEELEEADEETKKQKKKTREDEEVEEAVVVLMRDGDGVGGRGVRTENQNAEEIEGEEQKCGGEEEKEEISEVTPGDVGCKNPDTAKHIEEEAGHLPVSRSMTEGSTRRSTLSSSCGSGGFQEGVTAGRGAVWGVKENKQMRPADTPDMRSVQHSSRDTTLLPGGDPSPSSSPDLTEGSSAFSTPGGISNPCATDGPARSSSISACTAPRSSSFPHSSFSSSSSASVVSGPFHRFPFGRDTFVCPETPHTARLAAGAALTLCDLIMEEDEEVGEREQKKKEKSEGLRKSPCSSAADEGPRACDSSGTRERQVEAAEERTSMQTDTEEAQPEEKSETQGGRRKDGGNVAEHTRREGEEEAARQRTTVGGVVGERKEERLEVSPVSVGSLDGGERAEKRQEGSAEKTEGAENGEALGEERHREREGKKRRQNKIRRGFALIRPPGHHACSKEAAGFCIFNNAAVACEYLLEHYRLPRVAVFDWDVHHGNGTQDLFYSSSRVLYISVHRYDKRLRAASSSVDTFSSSSSPHSKSNSRDAAKNKKKPHLSSASSFSPLFASSSSCRGSPSHRNGKKRRGNTFPYADSSSASSPPPSPSSSPSAGSSFYPGTGNLDEIGQGPGKGYTLNIPLSKGYTDADMFWAFRTTVAPAIDRYRPHAIIISAGFDAVGGDPLGGCELTPGIYGWLTRQVKRLADRHAQGRLLLLLEGGYGLDILGECVASCLKELLREEEEDDEDEGSDRDRGGEGGSEQAGEEEKKAHTAETDNRACHCDEERGQEKKKKNKEVTDDAVGISHQATAESAYGQELSSRLASSSFCTRCPVRSPTSELRCEEKEEEERGKKKTLDASVYHELPTVHEDSASLCQSEEDGQKREEEGEARLLTRESFLSSEALLHARSSPSPSSPRSSLALQDTKLNDYNTAVSADQSGGIPPPYFALPPLHRTCSVCASSSSSCSFSCPLRSSSSPLSPCSSCHTLQPSPSCRSKPRTPRLSSSSCFSASSPLATPLQPQHLPPGSPSPSSRLASSSSPSLSPIEHRGVVSASVLSSPLLVKSACPTAGVFSPERALTRALTLPSSKASSSLPSTCSRRLAAVFETAESSSSPSSASSCSCHAGTNPPSSSSRCFPELVSRQSSDGAKCVRTEEGCRSDSRTPSGSSALSRHVREASPTTSPPLSPSSDCLPPLSSAGPASCSSSAHCSVGSRAHPSPWPPRGEADLRAAATPRNGGRPGEHAERFVPTFSYTRLDRYPPAERWAVIPPENATGVAPALPGAGRRAGKASCSEAEAASSPVSSGSWWSWSSSSPSDGCLSSPCSSLSNSPLPFLTLGPRAIATTREDPRCDTSTCGTSPPHDLHYRHGVVTGLSRAALLGKPQPLSPPRQSSIPVISSRRSSSPLQTSCSSPAAPLFSSLPSSFCSSSALHKDVVDREACRSPQTSCSEGYMPSYPRLSSKPQEPHADLAKTREDLSLEMAPNAIRQEEKPCAAGIEREARGHHHFQEGGPLHEQREIQKIGASDFPSGEFYEAGKERRTAERGRDEPAVGGRQESLVAGRGFLPLQRLVVCRQSTYEILGMVRQIHEGPPLFLPPLPPLPKIVKKSGQRKKRGGDGGHSTEGTTGISVADCEDSEEHPAALARDDFKDGGARGRRLSPIREQQSDVEEKETETEVEREERRTADPTEESWPAACRVLKRASWEDVEDEKAVASPQHVGGLENSAGDQDRPGPDILTGVEEESRKREEGSDAMRMKCRLKHSKARQGRKRQEGEDKAKAEREEKNKEEEKEEAEEEGEGVGEWVEVKRRNGGRRRTASFIKKDGEIEGEAMEATSEQERKKKGEEEKEKDADEEKNKTEVETPGVGISAGEAYREEGPLGEEARSSSPESFSASTVCTPSAGEASPVPLASPSSPDSSCSHSIATCSSSESQSPLPPQSRQAQTSAHSSSSCGSLSSSRGHHYDASKNEKDIDARASCAPSSASPGERLSVPSLKRGSTLVVIPDLAGERENEKQRALEELGGGKSGEDRHFPSWPRCIDRCTLSGGGAGGCEREREDCQSSERIFEVCSFEGDNGESPKLRKDRGQNEENTRKTKGEERCGHRVNPGEDDARGRPLPSRTDELLLLRVRSRIVGGQASRWLLPSVFHRENRLRGGVEGFTAAIMMRMEGKESRRAPDALPWCFHRQGGSLRQQDQHQGRRTRSLEDWRSAGNHEDAEGPQGGPEQEEKGRSVEEREDGERGAEVKSKRKSPKGSSIDGRRQRRSAEEEGLDARKGCRERSGTAKENGKDDAREFQIEKTKGKAGPLTGLEGAGGEGSEDGQLVTNSRTGGDDEKEYRGGRKREYPEKYNEEDEGKLIKLCNWNEAAFYAWVKLYTTAKQQGDPGLVGKLIEEYSNTFDRIRRDNGKEAKEGHSTGMRERGRGSLSASPSKLPERKNEDAKSFFSLPFDPESVLRLLRLPPDVVTSPTHQRHPRQPHQDHCSSSSSSSCPSSSLSTDDAGSGDACGRYSAPPSSTPQHDCILTFPSVSLSKQEKDGEDFDMTDVASELAKNIPQCYEVYWTHSYDVVSAEEENTSHTSSSSSSSSSSGSGSTSKQIRRSVSMCSSSQPSSASRTRDTPPADPSLHDSGHVQSTRGTTAAEPDPFADLRRPSSQTARNGFAPSSPGASSPPRPAPLSCPSSLPSSFASPPRCPRPSLPLPPGASGSREGRFSCAVALADVAQFVCPCVMDLKLGTQMVDPSCTDPVKVQRMREKARDRSFASHGFSVCGVLLHGGEADTQTKAKTTAVRESGEGREKGQGVHECRDRLLERSETLAHEERERGGGGKGGEGGGRKTKSFRLCKESDGGGGLSAPYSPSVLGEEEDEEREQKKKKEAVEVLDGGSVKKDPDNHSRDSGGEEEEKEAARKEEQDAGVSVVLEERTRRAEEKESSRKDHEGSRQSQGREEEKVKILRGPNSNSSDKKSRQLFASRCKPFVRVPLPPPLRISKQDAYAIRDDERFIQVFRRFFTVNGSPQLARRLINKCLDTLARLVWFFENQTQVSFYGSSLLFVFDACPSPRLPLLADSRLEGKTDLWNANHPAEEEGELTLGEEDRVGENRSKHHGRVKRADLKRETGRGLYQQEQGAEEGPTRGRILPCAAGVFEEKVKRQQEIEGEQQRRGKGGGAYRGDGGSKEGEEETEQEGDESDEAFFDAVVESCRVYMVDFAHVNFSRRSRDEGYLFGLRNLQRLFRLVLKDL